MNSRVEKAAKLTKAFEDFLRAVDRSPGSYPELLDTPVRTANMWLDELLDGYDWDPKDILSGGSILARDGVSELVIVRDIFFHSTCPHHLLPYHGIAHVAYLPSDRIVGLSKLARLVDCFAHRLILQEELAQGVADALVTHLGALGAACMLDAEQLCMVIRGVRKQGSRAIVMGYSGSMATDNEAKKQFLSAINAKE
ncbi:MAG: GTP cyclohydrolase I [Myxococcota bacterium]|jgi:GTP cyclohydrolase I|nr:GTP cyclohydrolase I [Myxococcota bacterium]